MTLWTPLAVNYFRHPKVATIPPRARLLHLAGFCYCQEHTTDGFIPAGVVPLLVNESGAAKGSPGELVESGLWERVDGGFRVDSWHEWNRYAADVKRQRASRRKGAEVTNHKRWHAENPDPTCSLCDVASESLSESPHTHTQTQPPYPPRSPVDNGRGAQVASRVYDLRQRMTPEQLEAQAES